MPYADVVAVETRLEAYPSQGMAIMQRAYQLTRRSGAAIFLFEEREIARRAGAPLKDLGVVLGGGGIMGAWFVRVPDWSTPSVSPGEQGALLRRSRLTGVFAAAALGIVIVIVVISYL